MLGIASSTSVPTVQPWENPSSPYFLSSSDNPYERLLGHPPSNDHLKSFGCLCFASTLSRNRTKFDLRAKAYFFLGYPFGLKGYKLYDLTTKSCFISRDVVFKESIFPFKHWVSKSTTTSLPITHSMFPCQPLVPDNTRYLVPSIFVEFSPPLSSVDIAIPPGELPHLVHLDQVASNPNLDSNFVSDVIVSSLPVPPLVRRFTRPHNPPTYLHDYHCNLASALASTSLTQSHESIATKSLGILYPFSSTLSYSKLFTPHRVFSIALSIAKEPDSYPQALKDPLWQATIKVEIDVLQANHTCVMTKLPPGKAPIGC